MTTSEKKTTIDYKRIQNIKKYVSFFSFAPFVCKLISHSSTLKRNRLTNITADAISNLSNLRILWVVHSTSIQIICQKIIYIFTLQIEYKCQFCLLFYCFFIFTLSVRFISQFILMLNEMNGFILSKWICGIVIWMTICLQRFQVNWENHQIYKNCMYSVIVFI